ncbi:MAG: CvpA family protein [Crocinitomicaceae bacterium]|nr:CvpA family protein [Crocinitomicaceae bacterium]
MEILDIILILPLIYGAWKGFQKGFVMELFTILALVVGLYAAFNFSDQFSKYMEFAKVDHSYMPALSFLVLFLAVGAMVYFGGKALEQVLKIAQLSTINKVVGASLGLLKWLYVSACVLMFFVSLDKNEKVIKKANKENSFMYAINSGVLKYSLSGVKHTDMLNVIEIQQTANEAKLTYDEVKRARQIADSLGIDASDVKTVIEIHEKYDK